MTTAINDAETAFRGILQSIHDTIGGIPAGVHRLTLVTPIRGTTRYVLNVSVNGLVEYVPGEGDAPEFDDRSLDIRMNLDKLSVGPLAAVN
jgi:hypothetical protein